MEIIRGKIAAAQKVVVYGPEGIGKSTFAARFPEPVFIDTEGSTKHLDVSRFPRPESWEELLGQARHVRNTPSVCATLVVDTADWAEQLCARAVCARGKKPGIEDFGYGKGYVYLGEEFGKLLALLDEVVGRGVNVVVTAHAKMRKFEQPDEMGAYDRWEMKLTKNTAPLVKEWADMVLFANYKTYTVHTDEGKVKAQGGGRVMYTTHHPCWDAKNRHGLPEELPFAYEGIAACIPGGGELEKAPDKPEAEKPRTLKGQKPAEGAPARVPASEPVGDAPPDLAEPEIPEDIPPALADLMRRNGAAAWEIQNAVALKGYYPRDTPIGNYDPQFVEGVLIGAWDQVFSIIKDSRTDLPF